MTNILLIEDSPLQAQILQDALKGRGLNTILGNTLQEGLSHVSNAISAVLLDLNLPDSQGLDTLSQFRKACPEMPVVIMTATEDLPTALEALRQGAQDYILKEKGDGTFLERVLHYAIERKRLESQLYEAMRVKSEFIGSASHELRTALTAIREGIALVSDGSAGSLNTDQQSLLGLAQANVERLCRMVNHVLAFQKLESGTVEYDFQLENLNHAVHDVGQIFLPLASKKQLVIQEDLFPNLPLCVFDKDKIIQVLSNLVHNAIQFTDTGSITLKTELKEETVGVWIRDEGVGIRETDKPFLFHEFKQVGDRLTQKRGGAGLGLAISKKIIDAHDGCIGVESVYGKGSSFYFYLPLKRKTHA